MMIKWMLSISALFASFWLAGNAFAQDLNAGRVKARACSACHGQLGIAVVPNAPNIAGENRRYLSSQLKAFRSGERQHDQMTFIAKNLSDEDIDNISRWFASIEVTAKAPDVTATPAEAPATEPKTD